MVVAGPGVVACGVLVRTVVVAQLRRVRLLLRQAEDRVDGLVLVLDLEVLVNKDDSLLQVVNELLPTLLLIEFLLEFLKVLLQDVVVLFI